MAGPIALVGGDEFRAGCEEMDRAIMRASGVEGPRVLILPTAAAFENPSKAASNGVEYFSSLGAKASSLMVLGPVEAGDEEFLSPIDGADVVYLTGGDPGHLLDTLQGSLLLEKLRSARERGAILAGSSAGAMVLGGKLRFRGWRDALGIVDRVVVLPHHEGSEPSKTVEALAGTAPSDALVVGIDGRTCCFGEGGDWRVMGPGAVTLYSQGWWRRYRAGETVPLYTPGAAS